MCAECKSLNHLSKNNNLVVQLLPEKLYNSLIFHGKFRLLLIGELLTKSGKFNVSIYGWRMKC